MLINIKFISELTISKLIIGDALLPTFVLVLVLSLIALECLSEVFYVFQLVHGGDSSLALSLILFNLHLQFNRINFNSILKWIN